MFKYIFALSFLLFATTFGTTAAIGAPPAPNLQVSTFQGTATPMVKSPYQYTIRVRNIGNQTATGVKLVVEFPLTATTPSQYILGKLTGYPSSCSVISNKLQCNLGSLNNSQIKSAAFTFEFQVSTSAPTLKATATTTNTNEVDAGNNTTTFTPVLSYPRNILTSATMLVTSCTGTGLTSFYECELFPSSQQSFTMNLDLGGTVSIPSYTGYVGLWDQNALTLGRSLHFTIERESGGIEADFNGFATNTACFEGITTFPGSTSAYNAAYRVCEQ